MRLLQCTKRCPRRNEAFFTIFKDKLLIRVEQKDTKGNKSVSAKYIYVDENGTPILTKDLDKYDTSNPKYLKKKVLPEVKIEETKTRTFPEWFNDEIMLNPDNIRVKNMQKLLSTESGRAIQQAFADGGRDAALILTSPYWIPSITSSVIKAPSVLGNAAKSLHYGFKYRPFATTGKLLLEGVGGAYIGNETGKKVNKVSKSLNNKTFGENIEQISNLPKGTGDLFNPGYYIGGSLGYLTWNKPIKRFTETVMRTTSAPNPIRPALEGFKIIYGEPIKQGAKLIKKRDFSKQNWSKTWQNGKRLRAISKYILTGKRSPDITYNSFNIRGDVYGGLNPYFSKGAYDATFSRNNYTTGDYIDAYLYNKPIEIAGIHKSYDDNFDIFSDYINKTYKDKIDKIPIYETDAESALFNLNDRVGKRFNGKVYPKSDKRSVQGEIETGRSGRSVNVAGHLKQFGITDNNQTVFRQQDIWKFNYPDYKKRWLYDDPFVENSKNRFSKGSKKLLLRIGSEIVDDMGTPIITRSPWFINN